MNQRIKLLANQAGYDDQFYEICREGLDKLAELIVRECASLAYDGPSGILDHFGLEEQSGVEE
jgi:hypothetical protein